ncbi:hypothetical protein BGX23_009622, partial [Mortierella sp. AD031]
GHKWIDRYASTLAGLETWLARLETLVTVFLKWSKKGWSSGAIGHMVSPSFFQMMEPMLLQEICFQKKIFISPSF